MKSSIKRKLIQAGHKPGAIIQLTVEEWVSLFKNTVLPTAYGRSIHFKMVPEDDGCEEQHSQDPTGYQKKLSYKLGTYDHRKLKDIIKKIDDCIIDNLHLLTDRSEVIITLDMFGLKEEKE